jgi:hypothetical protein
MQRLEKPKYEEIWVLFTMEEIKRFKKNWSNFKMVPKAISFKFDMNSRRLISKNFEDHEVGDLNAVISMVELAKRIAKV